MLVNVLSGAAALVGVGEAHLVDVVVALDHIVAGGGGGEGEHPVLIGQRGHGQGGLGGDGAHQQLHPVVHQLVVGVDGGLRIVDVVGRDEVELDVSVHGVDLIHSDLCGVEHVGTINGGISGQGAYNTDGEGIAASTGLTIVFVAAAGQHTHTHGARHEHGCNLSLFHFITSLYYRLEQVASIGKIVDNYSPEAESCQPEKYTMTVRGGRSLCSIVTDTRFRPPIRRWGQAPDRSQRRPRRRPERVRRRRTPGGCRCGPGGSRRPARPGPGRTNGRSFRWQ